MSSVKVSLQIRKSVLTVTPISRVVILVVDGPEYNGPLYGSGRVVPHLICMPEVSGLKPDSGLAVLIEMFAFVFSLSRQMPCNILNVDHDHFLPHLHSTICDHFCSNSTLCCWYIYIFFFFFDSPCAPRPLFSFLIYSQSVGLLGRVISSSQGLYLNTEQHKHRINSCTHQTSMP
jgi:hypothetical protein